MFFKQTFTIGAKWNFIKLQNVRKLEEQDTVNTVAFSWINFELNQTCSFKQRSTHKNTSYEGLVLIFLIFSQLIVSFLHVVTWFSIIFTCAYKVSPSSWGCMGVAPQPWHFLKPPTTKTDIPYEALSPPPPYLKVKLLPSPRKMMLPSSLLKLILLTYQISLPNCF